MIDVSLVILIEDFEINENGLKTNQSMHATHTHAANCSNQVATVRKLKPMRFL